MPNEDGVTARWGDGYEWKIPNITKQDLDEKHEGLIFFRGKLDDEKVLAQRVNKGPKSWVQMTKSGGQVCQMCGFGEDMFPKAQAFMAEIAHKYCTQEYDKAQIEILKTEWLLDNGIQPTPKAKAKAKGKAKSKAKAKANAAGERPAAAEGPKKKKAKTVDEDDDEAEEDAVGSAPGNSDEDEEEDEEEDEADIGDGEEDEEVDKKPSKKTAKETKTKKPAVANVETKEAKEDEPVAETKKPAVVATKKPKDTKKPKEDEPVAPSQPQKTPIQRMTPQRPKETEKTIKLNEKKSEPDAPDTPRTKLKGKQPPPSPADGTPPPPADSCPPAVASASSGFRPDDLPDEDDLF